MAGGAEADLDGIGALAPGEMAPGVPLDDFPPYLLNRIVNRLNVNLSEDLKKIGFSLQQYRVLAVLMAGNNRNVGELSMYTVIEQSTLSKMLDRMEESGLVERHPDPADRRVVQIAITGDGRNAYKRIVPVAMAHCRAAMRGLADDERAMLVDLLHRVLENVVVPPLT